MVCAALLLMGAACTNDNPTVEISSEAVRVESMLVDLMGIDDATGTRAVSDYAVNGSEDPTATLTGRELWSLSVDIYEGSSVYSYGQGTFIYNAATGVWEPDSPIYFPNYTRQQVTATLEPPSWSGIDPDQESAARLLAQDVLMQNGDTVLNPAHILTIEMKHAFSMLDFRITDVIESDITAVTVEAGSVTYTPYQVRSGTNLEYMVIVPVGTVAPVISITTAGGIGYRQTTVDAITGTAVNRCYCFTLEGFELSLAEITVSDWTRGAGIAGEYTTEQSYPTFRGASSQVITLYYDNGLEQNLVFNEQGETTVRPFGRTITAYRTDTSGGVVTLATPIVLRGMIIDITGLF